MYFGKKCITSNRITHTTTEVNYMAKNLADLLKNSSSTRRYFISLPVWLQVILHEEHDNIRTAAQLHLTADILLKQINII